MVVNKCYWPTVRYSYLTYSWQWYGTQQPVIAVVCWYIHSFIDENSVSADLFRTATRNVSLQPYCISTNTHCSFTQCLVSHFLSHIYPHPFLQISLCLIFLQTSIQHTHSSLLGTSVSNHMQYVSPACTPFQLLCLITSA